MIRLVHFADLHLGVENYGRMDSQTGLSSRVRDFLDRLDELVDFAIREQVDAVTFAGDAFRGRRVDPTYQNAFARRILRLSQAGIQVVLVAGNHDLGAVVGKAASVDVFRALEVPNVHVSVRQEDVFLLDFGEGRQLQVATFPYMHRNRVLAVEEQRRKSLREQEDFFREQVAQNLLALAERVDPDIPAILVGHLMVMGADVGSEQRMTLGMEVDANPGLVANPVYDAVLLGHVHRGQVLRGRGPVVLYPGTLARVDFGDEGQEKGFVLVEIEAGPAGERPVTYRVIPVQARPFLTLDVDARKGDPMEKALRKIEDAEDQLADAVVRLRLQVCEEDAGQVDVMVLRRALGAAFYVAAVKVDVERPDRVTFRGDMGQLGPREALERYWIGRGVSAERREVLLAHLEELMAEDAASG